MIMPYFGPMPYRVFLMLLEIFEGLGFLPRGLAKLFFGL